MNAESEGSVLSGLLKQAYHKVFFENWPIWLGGLLIGIMSVNAFAWARPWGVAGGLRNWGDWFFNLVGIYQREPVSPLISSNSILTLAWLWGAFGSARMSNQFIIRRPVPLNSLRALWAAR